MILREKVMLAQVNNNDGVDSNYSISVKIMPHELK